MQRLGLYPGGPKPPFGAGFEIAGIVEKAGKDAAQWEAGDAVMGFCEAGYSEYVLAGKDTLFKKPDSLDFNQAAAIPCQYLTAHHALLTLGKLVSGQTVLIQAAAGGLGTFLVQIASNAGATLIGTCSSNEKCEYLREIGCAHPVNYAARDFAEEVRQITGQQGCDLVGESVGGDVFDRSLRCVKPRGRLIVLGVASAQPRAVQALDLLVNNLTVSGFHLFGYLADREATANAVRDLDAWLASGTLKVVVQFAFPLERAADAHEAISARKTVGKVVLDVAAGG
jgi:NADPH2:quinone reductase